MNDERETPKGYRKKTSQKRQRTASIEAVLTAEERAEIEERAAAAGLSLSAFIRACALGDAGPRARRRPVVDTAKLAETHIELKRVGNNLNQIAKAINTGHAPPLIEVQRAGEELSLVLFEIASAMGYRPKG